MARRWSYGRVGSGIPGCTSLVQGLPSEWVSVRDFLEALVGDGITGDLTGDIEPSSTTTRLTSPTAEPLLIEITSIMGDRVLLDIDSQLARKLERILVPSAALITEAWREASPPADAQVSVDFTGAVSVDSMVVVDFTEAVVGGNQAKVAKKPELGEFSPV